jgi:dienelactone hydrolase
METFLFDRVARACAGVLLLLAGSAQAFVGRVDLPGADEPFTDAAIVRGVKATREQCVALPGGVWAEPPGESGECLRYWHAGLAEDNPQRPLFFFAGDLLGATGVFRGYAGTHPAAVQSTVNAAAKRLGVPYIFLARPGTYGSSGEHKQRRRVAEARLVSAAIDEIKQKHGLTEIGLAGVSGGGHVVASLIGYRSDIVCAVPASAVSSPQMRVKLRGWTVDATGYHDSHEPIDHLDKAVMHPALRVIVVGDPADSNVPWPVQTALAERLAAIGRPAQVVEVEGTGSERHVTNESARVLGAMCLKNQSNEEIRQRAGQGLKG